MDDSKSRTLAQVLGVARLSGDQHMPFPLEILAGRRALVFLVGAGAVDQLLALLLGAKKTSLLTCRSLHYPYANHLPSETRSVTINTNLFMDRYHIYLTCHRCRPGDSHRHALRRQKSDQGRSRSEGREGLSRLAGILSGAAGFSKRTSAITRSRIPTARAQPSRRCAKPACSQESTGPMCRNPKSRGRNLFHAIVARNAVTPLTPNGALVRIAAKQPNSPELRARRFVERSLDQRR